MKRSWRYKTPVLIVTAGSIISLISLFWLQPANAGAWGIVVGVAVSQCSVLFLRQTDQPSAQEEREHERSEIDRQKAELENWHQAQTEQLQQQASRIQEQQRDLAARYAGFQEFAEYPVADTRPDAASDAIRLSEKDREVHALLESEAERVYEKIRQNGYSKNGGVDTETIRTEIHQLIQKIAQIYSPNSSNPLLETSFEQLARSASRICLHTLVLLEQLPVDVKRYNIRDMYSYVRKAVQGYGAWQQVSPWLKHVSRGAYMGRLAAGTNPVTLGAWWLATEVGRRGAQKLVENVVDRQAVAALHDLVTIIGVEAAGIYGPGHRQRDAAWVYGAELTELLHRFPVSRDSLQKGLREVTALPLRSEYDRIYLYRCVAGHRASGLRLADPAILTRAEREHIAAQLEAFFAQVIHGVTDEQKQDWQQEVESRLDLKLKLADVRDAAALPGDAASAIRAVYAFVTSVAGATSQQAIQFLETDELMIQLPLERRTELLGELSRQQETARFEPPDIDPKSDLTQTFLRSLMTGSVVAGQCDHSVKELLLETACYFRCSREESQTMLDSVFRARLQVRCHPDVSLKNIDAELVQITFHNLDPEEMIVAIYDSIEVCSENSREHVSDTVLIVTQRTDTSAAGRLLIIGIPGIIWTSEGSVSISRSKGFLIDDCLIAGGKWLSASKPADCRILISGSMTGGGYQRFFGPILRHQ